MPAGRRLGRSLLSPLAAVAVTKAGWIVRVVVPPRPPRRRWHFQCNRVGDMPVLAFSTRRSVLATHKDSKRSRGSDVLDGHENPKTSAA